LLFPTGTKDYDGKEILPRTEPMLKKFRPALWPTVITLPLLALLIVLGTWQVMRLGWKRDLISTTESQLKVPPAELPAFGVDPEQFNYRPVTVRGTFHHDKEIYLIAHTKRGEFGYHVITPLERTDGGFVLVNRGWVPTLGRDPLTRLEGQLTGVQGVRGISRKPWRQGSFVPDNDPAKNVWFYGDLAGMAAHWGLDVVPVFVEADTTANPGGWPKGGQTKLKFTNNHLQYAVTWYSLALVLLVIYLLYHRREGRL
jgi:surfeit locus 1 family protein